uniref:Uncharacterized protein n=1 Tax=Oryza sativa subsp. japonica TaxID=39947 RepID=Q6YT88_ORYSJ|nr:hypothetical protein [Oryza sativa Japonica Group]
MWSACKNCAYPSPPLISLSQLSISPSTLVPPLGCPLPLPPAGGEAMATAARRVASGARGGVDDACCVAAAPLPSPPRSDQRDARGGRRR